MRSHRVLIVEDSRPSQVGLAALLKREPGLESVEVADTVAQAIDHFRDDAAPPDVVILDLDLPGQPGEDLIRFLIHWGEPKPRIVVTSGICDYRRIEDVKALGPDVYLTKPYDRDQLLAAVAGDDPAIS